MPDAPSPEPQVSIVMATYNRSNILRFVIETVRRQTLQDWELLVVGDGCTDDTASVVERFGDPRIRFWNLEQPAGEQSGPNNAGVGEARGRFLAFLNHDDYWMPRHLERTLHVLEHEPSVDMVFGLNLAIYPDGHRILWGGTTGGNLPMAGVPASSWVMRRSFAARVGTWRFSRELHAIPSQDWLRRANATGTLKLVPILSVLSFPSSARARSYSERADREHAYWFERLENDPGLGEELLTTTLIDRDVTSWRSGNSPGVLPFFRRGILNAGKRMLMWIGVSPLAAALWWRHGKRGGFIANARRVRGLPPVRLKS